ncbi:MAG TPA: T9SS type A sorting domain-containing protein, partial [Ferruginibacter sp.]|nr:T9SS type A sorting domain-containing protein [Ferruginibacter sp.]
GLNYYRLRITDKDAAIRYSPIRKLSFTGTDNELTIYPNPVVNGRLVIASPENCTLAILYDAAGKQVRRFALQGRTHTLDLTGVAKGIYQVKIFTRTTVHTERILVQ